MEYFFIFIFICAGIKALFYNNTNNPEENQESNPETMNTTPINKTSDDIVTYYYFNHIDHEDSHLDHLHGELHHPDDIDDDIDDIDDFDDF